LLSAQYNSRKREDGRILSGNSGMEHLQAAEALGAIGAAECTPLLQESLVSDPAPEVQQTCELALHRIQQGQALDNTQQSPFLSVDPAVAALSSLSVADLRCC
jgi:deoxyhypusine monooxygenase